MDWTQEIAWMELWGGCSPTSSERVRCLIFLRLSYSSSAYYSLSVMLTCLDLLQFHTKSFSRWSGDKCSVWLLLDTTNNKKRQRSVLRLVLWSEVMNCAAVAGWNVTAHDKLWMKIMAIKNVIWCYGRDNELRSDKSDFFLNLTSSWS